jgi:hypothetical protein
VEHLAEDDHDEYIVGHICPQVHGEQVRRALALEVALGPLTPRINGGYLPSPASGLLGFSFSWWLRSWFDQPKY